MNRRGVVLIAKAKRTERERKMEHSYNSLTIVEGTFAATRGVLTKMVDTVQPDAYRDV